MSTHHEYYVANQVCFTVVRAENPDEATLRAERDFAILNRKDLKIREVRLATPAEAKSIRSHRRSQHFS